MKRHTAGLAFVVALGFAAIAPAAPKPSGRLELLEPASLNGTELSAGTYKLSWTGTGTELAVTVSKGGKVVVETRGKLVEMSRAVSDDSIVTRKDKNGNRTLEEVRFGGSKSKLVFSAS